MYENCDDKGELGGDAQHLTNLKKKEDLAAAANTTTSNVVGNRKCTRIPPLRNHPPPKPCLQQTQPRTPHAVRSYRSMLLYRLGCAVRPAVSTFFKHENLTFLSSDSRRVAEFRFTAVSL